MIMLLKLFPMFLKAEFPYGYVEGTMILVYMNTFKNKNGY